MTNQATGDWYCKNCGYILQVTYSETCTTCHQPAEWHEADQRTALEEAQARIAELQETNRSLLAEKAELVAKITECEEFLKEDESPAECIERNRIDAIYALKQAAKCAKERDQLAAQILVLSNKSIELVDAIENKEGFDKHKWALRCGLMVNRVRDVVSESPAASVAELQAKQIEEIAEGTLAIADALEKKYAESDNYPRDPVALYREYAADLFDAANQKREQAQEAK